jgi:hypothetical protein
MFQVILPDGNLSQNLKLGQAKAMAEKIAVQEWKKSNRAKLSWHH